MLDRDALSGLLLVAAVVGVVVVLVAAYCNRLERRYAAEMEIPDDDEESGSPAPDQPPVRYHAQVLAQASVSYYISLFFALLGFVLLVDADGDGRGMASAIIALALAVVFAVESRSSRAGMLEKTQALQAERVRLLSMVSDDEARNQLIAELLLRGEQVGGEQDIKRSPAASGDRAR
jgi:hypothetical protein